MSTLSIEQTVALRRARNRMVAARIQQVAAATPLVEQGYWQGDEWFWGDASEPSVRDLRPSALRPRISPKVSRPDDRVPSAKSITVMGGFSLRMAGRCYDGRHLTGRLQSE